MQCVKRPLESARPSFTVGLRFAWSGCPAKNQRDPQLHAIHVLFLIRRCHDSHL